MIYVVSFLCSNEYLMKRVTHEDDFIVMCNTITLHAFVSRMVGKQVLTEGSLLLQFEMPDSIKMVEVVWNVRQESSTVQSSKEVQSSKTTMATRADSIDLCGRFLQWDRM